MFTPLLHSPLRAESLGRSSIIESLRLVAPHFLTRGGSPEHGRLGCVNLVWRFVGAGCETWRFVVKTKKSPLLRLSCLILSIAQRLSKSEKRSKCLSSFTDAETFGAKKGSAANRRFGVDVHEQSAVASCTSPGGGWLGVCVSRDEDGAFSRQDRKSRDRVWGQ